MFIKQKNQNPEQKTGAHGDAEKTFQEEKMSLTKVVRGRAKTAKPPYGAQFMENVQKLS